MNTFMLNIATPEGNIFSGKAEMISIRGADGDLAVLAGHMPFTTTVVPCKCKIYLPDGSENHLRIESGLLTVSKECVTLLSGSAAFE